MPVTFTVALSPETGALYSIKFDPETLNPPLASHSLIHGYRSSVTYGSRYCPFRITSTSFESTIEVSDPASVPGVAGAEARLTGVITVQVVEVDALTSHALLYPAVLHPLIVMEEPGTIVPSECVTTNCVAFDTILEIAPLDVTSEVNADCSLRNGNDAVFPSKYREISFTTKGRFG